ncbi:MAG: hypothetical protein HN742_35975 [Lentisphaerae bacterium]|nr:hypothetical protein [Lentisphaerota bacterium]MBT7061311.1 hypothetical protein [Lentisphaerota bacterium]MBT7847324.1 hypothetical protein [Lentisphaerota bacterium]
MEPRFPALGVPERPRWLLPVVTFLWSVCGTTFGEPRVETPDPGIAASWDAIDAQGLSLIPAPKELSVIGEALPVTDAWGIHLVSPGLEPGRDELNRRLEQNRGKALPENAETASRIVVGTYADMGAFLPLIDNPPCPPRQGYVIGMASQNGGVCVVVAGADAAGARYGCVTLGKLLQPGPSLLRTRVRDWPDFKHRMAFSLPSSAKWTPGLVARAKGIIDQSFRAKLNMVFERKYSQGIEALIADATPRRELTEYAAARGVRIMVGRFFNVGQAPYPGAGSGYGTRYYPHKTEEGLIGYSNMAFTWCRDDLIDAAAAKYAELMQLTGADTFYIHAMDTGGRDNPENWNHRTPRDIERFGDNRAAADANLMGRIHARLKETNPDVLSLFVAYPYVATYLEFPEVDAWLRELSRLMPEDVHFCLRESPRPLIEEWHSAAPRQGRLNYFGPYPYRWGLLSSAAGRYARTFYFDDKDVLWYLTNGTRWHQFWVAAEYSWNTQAPGWGWLPAGGGLKGAEFVPPEIGDRLLRRVAVELVGPDAAEAVLFALLQNPSCRIAAAPQAMEGLEEGDYFAAKLAGAKEAVAGLEAVEDVVAPHGAVYMVMLLKHMREAVAMLEARHQILRAEALMDAGQEKDAQAAASKAQLALRPFARDHYIAKPLWTESDISVRLSWRKIRDAYLRTLGPATIKLGAYSFHSFPDGVLQSLGGLSQCTTSRLADLDQAALSRLNVVFFAATTDMHDTTEDWRANLQAFVRNGGGVVFSHNAVGRTKGSAFADPVFPSICAGFAERVVGSQPFTVGEAHAIFEGRALGSMCPNEYTDYCALRPGPKGTVVLRDAEGSPVMVTGSLGSGRVVYTGQCFGLTADALPRECSGDEWKLLYHTVRWAASGGEQ